MPQVYDNGPVRPEPKKKKKPPEDTTRGDFHQRMVEASTNRDLGSEIGEVQQYAYASAEAQRRSQARYTRSVARETTQAIRQQEKAWLYSNTLLNAPERGDVIAGLNQRASILSPQLLANAPKLAAELLLGETKTRDLRTVSQAAYDGWVQHQQALRAEAQRMAFAADPEGFRIGQAIQNDPIALDLFQRSDNIRDPEAKQYFIQNIILGLDMNGAAKEAQYGGLDAMYDEMVSGTWEPTGDPGFLQFGPGDDIASVAGELMNAPILGVSRAADLAGKGLKAAGQDDAAGFLDVLQEGVGDTLGAAGTAVQFVQRNAQGAAVLAGELPSMAYHSVFGGRPEGGYLTADELTTTWGEVEDGEHSPFAIIAARMLETDVNDPKYQSLFTLTDMTVDLIGQVALFKGLSAFKKSIRATQLGGGVVSGETMVNSYLLGGPRLVKHIWQTLKENAHLPESERAVVLEHTYKKGMTPHLAQDLASATSEGRTARILADGLDDVPDRQIPKIQSRIEVINEELSKLNGRKRIGPKTRAGIASLEAEKVSLEQKVWDLINREPIFEFPRISHIRPFMRGVGTGFFTGSKAGKILAGIVGEGGRVDFSKIGNEIVDHDGSLINPDAVAKPEGWASHNFDLIRKTMDVLKVDKATQRTVMAAMFDVERGTLSAYEWRTMIEKAYKTGKRYTPEMEAEVRLSTKTVDERTYSYIEVASPDGTIKQVQPAIADEFGNPIPVRNTQSLGPKISMPRIQYLDEATHWVARLDRWMKDKPYLAKKYQYLRVPAAWARFSLFVAPRLLFRAAMLVVRPGRLAGKFEVDQGMRGFLAEGMTPLDYYNALGRRALKGFRTKVVKVLPEGAVDFEVGGMPVAARSTESRLPVKEMKDAKGQTHYETDWGPTGSVMSEQMADVVYHRERASTNLDPNLLPREARTITNGVYERLEGLAVDQLTKRIALYGPEATLRWMEKNPTHPYVETFNRDILPGLERAGKTTADAIAAQDLEIQQATGMNPALREAIGTGRWKTTEPLSSSAALELEFIKQELAEAKDTLSLTQDGVMRENLNLRIEQMEAQQQLLGERPQTRQTIPLRDAAEVSDQILRDWQNGNYRMPADVYVKRALARHDPALDTATRLERAHAWANRVNQRVYKGFTPMNWATRNASRGSLYSKVFDRVEADLLKRGYSAERAVAIAQHRATFITKDLMYDLSARSSMDRRLQEYFWFEPVWREQLSVWLSKMPTKAFWAPGIALEYSMAHTLLEGLKDMGLMIDRVVNADGETQPYLQTPFGEISIGGMDPLTPGGEGQWPTLSSGAEGILDYTATHVPEEYKHYFDTMADLFTFDKDTSGTPWLPYSISETLAGPIAIAQLFGLETGIENTTLGLVGEQRRRTIIQARQWAMSDLAEDGILPPTDASDAGFMKDMAAFSAKVEERARYYDPGITLLRILTGAFLVGSVRDTGVAPAGQAFNQWREETLKTMEYGDEYFAAQDEYLAAHPEAWPYAVGRTQDDEAPYYPDPAYDPDATLNPEKFTDKAMYLYRTYFDPDVMEQAAQEEADAQEALDPTNFAPALSMAAYEAATPRRQMRLKAAWTFEEPTELTLVQATVVGMPEFPERGLMLNNLKQINDRYDELIDSDMNEDRIEFLEHQRDLEITHEVAQYGDNGKAVMDYIEAPPSKRLMASGFFTGPEAENVVSAAAKVRRDVFEEFPEASMAGAAESYGTLQKKADLFNKIDAYRKKNPAFDRQMRYIEFGLGEKTPLGRIEVYQFIFFGERFYDSGLAADVAREMNK